MSQHSATLHWQRGTAAFVDNAYSRLHEVHFDGGLVLRASSSPHVVKVPYSDPTAADPEEMFVAALASCHMLWFLSLAATAGWVVDSYQDAAVGTMAVGEQGRAWVSQVTLHPAVQFCGPPPSLAELHALHHQAHAQCFIANSVRTDVRCEPVLS